MRVAIVGSRSCPNMEKDEIRRHLPADCHLIVSGGARGVDHLAELVARENGIGFLKIVPDYNRYGRIAPLVRNTEIVEQSDLVLAFWDFYSRGTAATIAACIARQIPVEIIGIAGK